EISKLVLHFADFFPVSPDRLFHRLQLLYLLESFLVMSLLHPFHVDAVLPEGLGKGQEDLVNVRLHHPDLVSIADTVTDTFEVCVWRSRMRMQLANMHDAALGAFDVH